ncbi:MAG: acyl-CoA dehydrogenase family protein [Candidatus Sphingomonas colombiensis]|nr:acyl-CoA dehydrogenase family protein [Sphingomonas sp.]WEK42022.1 MAG: acyl-CoA dehydrogenase family protein [Sphingomonas sp.]
MDMLLTEDQLALAETVRDYLAGTHGPEVLRRLDEGDKRDPAIWQGLVDMGLTGLLVPEDQGGLGLGLVDAALVAVECGRACLAEPLVDTALVGVPWLIARGETDKLAAIAAGELRLPLPHPLNPWIADGDGAALDSIDPLRKLARPKATAADDAYLFDLAALMSAAQLVGLAEAMLAQATDYAKIRTQFGQPIGAFQAVKHQLASAAVAIEFARPVVWRAAQALEDGLASAPIHLSHAKLAASDAATLTAETAIQVHGAMGYTYEVDLHYWMKRSWALSGAWGSRAFHLARVDAAVIGGSLPIGPEHTFA